MVSFERVRFGGADEAEVLADCGLVAAEGEGEGGTTVPGEGGPGTTVPAEGTATTATTAAG